MSGFTRQVKFVEVGTCDFDVEALKYEGEYGISVEPVRTYFDRLPNNPKLKKLMYLVSDKQGEAQICYIPEDKIKQYGLPDYVKGCNSINAPHPTVEKLCKEKGIDYSEVVQKDTVPCKTLYQIVTECKVDGIYHLKTDTEGHDCFILTKYFDDIIRSRYNDLLPQKITFESNELNDANQVKALISKLQSIGYVVTTRRGDTFAELDITKLNNKSKFSTPIYNTYISGVPAGYSKNNLPHENNLESAKEYCKKHGYSGVTFQNGFYGVRTGNRVLSFNPENSTLCTWVYI